MTPARFRWIDPALALALTALGVPIAASGSGGGWGTALAIVTMPAVTVPLIWRRRAPLATAAAFAAGVVASGLPTLDQTRCGVAIPAALLIVFSLAARCERRAALTGLGVVLAAMVFLLFTDPVLGIAALFVLPLCAGVWGAGRLARSHARMAAELAARIEALQQTRADIARLAVELERTRLASDFDLVIRRGIGELVALASRGQSADERDVDGARERFAQIEEQGRESLGQLRSMLGALRSDADHTASSAGRDAPPAPTTSAPRPAARRWRSWRGDLLALALLGVLLASGGSPVPCLLLTVGPWAAWRVVRARRALRRALADRAHELEREHEALARLARQHERLRIARDLHDVVGNRLAVAVVQAAAGRLGAGDPTGMRAGFSAIRRVGGDALADTGRIVELLRDEQHESDTLRGVIDRAAAAGLALDVLALPDAGQLSPTIELTACRIVQEGLTNVVKHAPGARVSVCVTVSADELEIELSDHGGDAATELSRAGAGVGLAGIRERVEPLGGSLEAGPHGSSGWRLRARIPLQTRLPATSRG